MKPFIEKSTWYCELCGRRENDIGKHPLPKKQKAHLIPNRLSGAKTRYRGVKNPFRPEELNQFLSHFRGSFPIPSNFSDDEAKRILNKLTTNLCGECHEEVLSEPIYLPEVLGKLKPFFRGKSRVEKVITITEVLRLGVEALTLSRNGG